MLSYFKYGNRDRICEEIRRMFNLIWLVVVFLLLALLFYVFSAKGIAGLSRETAKMLMIIFIIVAIITLLFWSTLIVQRLGYPNPYKYSLFPIHNMAKLMLTPGHCLLCKEEVTKRTIETHILKNHQVS